MYGILCGKYKISFVQVVGMSCWPGDAVVGDGRIPNLYSKDRGLLLKRLENF